MLSVLSQLGLTHPSDKSASPPEAASVAPTDKSLFIQSMKRRASNSETELYNISVEVEDRYVVPQAPSFNHMQQMSGDARGRARPQQHSLADLMRNVPRLTEEEIQAQTQVTPDLEIEENNEQQTAQTPVALFNGQLTVNR